MHMGDFYSIFNFKIWLLGVMRCSFRPETKITIQDSFCDKPTAVRGNTRHPSMANQNFEKILVKAIVVFINYLEVHLGPKLMVDVQHTRLLIRKTQEFSL